MSTDPKDLARNVASEILKHPKVIFIGVFIILAVAATLHNYFAG